MNTTTTAPAPARLLESGTVVRYHGGRARRHGLYVVTGPCDCFPHRLEDCAGRYRLRRYLGPDTPPSAFGITHINPADLTPVDPDRAEAGPRPATLTA